MLLVVVVVVAFYDTNTRLCPKAIDEALQASHLLLLRFVLAL